MRLAVAASGEFSIFKTSNDQEESDEQRAKTLKHLEEQAHEISHELGKLKGSVMKVGQLLSMYGEHFLPPQVNAILKTLQASSPPLAWEAIAPVLKKELGANLEELEVDAKAIAAASIGQVHAARIKSTNQTIALKIQYPGVDRAIQSDLRALRGLAAFAPLAAPALVRGPRLAEFICEIEEMLAKEVDYRSEADCSEKFAELLAGDSRYVIPKIHRHWSSSKVLATDKICGHRFDAEALQKLPPERRNALAESLIDLYLRELFEFGCVQTDPHVGNYLVRLQGEFTCDGQLIENDAIVLFDFGAVRKLDPHFIQNYRTLVEASLFKNKEAVSDAALELKFLLPCDPPAVHDAFYDFCRLVVEPFDPSGADDNGRTFFDSEDRYDWSRSDLPTRLRKRLVDVIRARELRVPPREAIFIDRKSSGLYVLLGLLGAKTRGRERLSRTLQAAIR
jgi:predicted unusual protein kinase regulating ubiquinone biosynthesis (AarF/ABC1/UbiB family)